jgi:flagellar hook-basal body complex protein FliE
MSDISIGGRMAPSPSATAGRALEAKKTAPADFGSILGGMINNVDTLQQKANGEIAKVQLDKSGSIHEVMIAMEKADISFRTMMLMRNKLLEAYQEVMRLQV